MSGKRTKLQKQRAEVRRQVAPPLLGLAPSGAVKLESSTPLAMTEKILGYDFKVLYQDLTKTAIVTAIIIAILVGVVVGTPWFV
jgi:hypothetical protein